MPDWGSHRASVRREMRSFQRGLRQFQREVGVTITWYEFDAAASTSDDTYDEGPVPDPLDPSLVEPGPGLVFKPPKSIPAVWYRFMPPTNIQTETGEYTVNRSVIRFSTDAIRRAHLMNPLDPSVHFNDRYAFNGILYRVEDYAPRGQLYGQYIMVDVAGRELKPDELVDSNLSQTSGPVFSEKEGTEVIWTPGQQLDWPPTQPPDWNTQPPVH